MNGEGRAFVDTSVLVYAYDVDAGDKHLISRRLIRDLWRTRRGVLSTQVLQEFYVTVTRKLPKTLTPTEARGIVATYRAWPVQTIDVTGILGAAEMAERERFSFWDALIMAAAQAAGADRVLSEDLQAGRRVAGIVIEDPFAS